MASASAPLSTSHASAQQDVTFALHVLRFQLIETAEEGQLWSSRVRRQWGSGNVIALRAMMGSTVVGLTPPQALHFSSDVASPPPSTTSINDGNSASSLNGPQQRQPRRFSGIEWPESMSFDLPWSSVASAVLTLEVLSFATIPPRVCAISVVNAQSFIQHSLSTSAFSSRRPVLTQRFAVHSYPSLAGSESSDKNPPTHAVLVVELRATSASAVAASFCDVGGGSGNVSFVSNVPQSGNVSFTLAGGRQQQNSSRNGSFAPPLTTVGNSSAVGGSIPGRSNPAAASSTSLSPLDFNFGPVRVSTLRMYFPTCFLNDSGQYVVSNIICAMNNTENGVLSLQLVARRRGGERRDAAIDPSQLLLVYPREPVLVRPQQRAFFSLTWGIGRSPVGFRSLQESVLVQLCVAGPVVPSSPIEFEVMCAHPPQDSATDHYPFHYWVNTTMLTNRPLSEERELPYVRSVLPVFLFLKEARARRRSLLALGHADAAAILGAQQRTNGSSSAVSTRGDDEDDADLLVRDKDGGGFVIVDRTMTGAALSWSSPQRSAGGGSASSISVAASQEDLVSTGLAWLQPYGQFDSLKSIPRLRFMKRCVRCVLHLGSVRGLPMMYTQIGTNAVAAAVAIRSTGTAGSASSEQPPVSLPPVTPLSHAPAFFVSEDTDSTSTTTIAAAAAGSSGGDTVSGSSPTAESISAPAFRVTMTALQSGWTVVRGESNAAYQTQSGSINWHGDTLVALKQPDAALGQCFRLDLNEVNAEDNDEMPIGCTVMALPEHEPDSEGECGGMPRFYRALCAFFVYDSFSQYDKLQHSALLLRETVWEFQEIVM